jgi:hypothetical protein
MFQKSTNDWKTTANYKKVFSSIIIYDVVSSIMVIKLSITSLVLKD